MQRDVQLLNIVSKILLCSDEAIKDLDAHVKNGASVFSTVQAIRCGGDALRQRRWISKQMSRVLNAEHRRCILMFDPGQSQTELASGLMA